MTRPNRHQPRSRATMLAAALLILIGTVASVSIVVGGARTDHVGGSDSANTLVVARNLLAGRGFTVDYVATYLDAWPSVTHPEDSFPLFQPALIAAMTMFTGNVFSAGHLLNALLAFGYLALLPLLIIRWYGPFPGVLFAAGLYAQEGFQSLFERPLNDAGAMALFGASALFLFRSIDRSQYRDHQSHSLLVAASVFAALATLYKSSTAFFVLACVFALLVLNTHCSVKQRLRQSATILGAVAIAHLPVVLWHHATFGYFSLPHNRAGREVAREIATSSNFWKDWAKIRTYFFAHPDSIPSLDRRIARQGFFSAAIVAPMARAYVGLRNAFFLAQVIPLPWLAFLGIGAHRRHAFSMRTAAWFSLIASAFALLIPMFSHYEPRYFYPLRPIIALAAAIAAHHWMQPFTKATKASLEYTSLAVFCAATLLGLLKLGRLPLHTTYLAATGMALFFVLIAPRLLHPRSHLWSTLHLKPPSLDSSRIGLALVTTMFAIAFALTMNFGVERLFSAGFRRTNPDRDVGLWLQSITKPDDIVMARFVWQISLFSERRSIITPTNAEDICAAANRYNARFLLTTNWERDNQPDVLDYANRQHKLMAQSESNALYELDCQSTNDKINSPSSLP